MHDPAVASVATRMLISERGRRVALAFWAPAGVLACATCAGLLLGSVVLVCLSGLLIYLYLFLLFAAGTALAEWARRLDENYLAPLGPAGLPFAVAFPVQLVRLTARLTGQTVLIFRALVLFVSLHVPGLYASLALGEFQEYAARFKFALAFGLLGLGVAALDLMGGKSIRNQGLGSRFIGTWGALSFFTNLLVLAAGAQGGPELRTMDRFLNHPFWMMSTDQLVGIWRGPDGPAVFGFLFVALPVAVLVPLKRNYGGFTDDQRNFARAAILLCAWLLTIPLTLASVFLYTRLA